MDHRIVAIRTGFVAAGLLAANAQARDGDLDPTFGSNGVAIVEMGASSTAFGLAFAPDGRIVLGGTIEAGATGTDFAVARLSRDGMLDPAFSFDGWTTAAIGTGNVYDGSFNTIVQADGKIVLIGEGADTDVALDDGDFKLARFNTDGTLDTSFSGDGKAYVDFNLGGNDEDRALDAVQLANGKLVVVGSAMVAPSDTDIAVARLNADGSRDTSFDSDGRLTFSFDLDPNFPGEIASSVAIDGAGNIVIAGAAAKGGINANDFAIARLLPSGAFDPNFGGDGRVTVAFDLGDTLEDTALELLIAPDGSIFVSGGVKASGYDFAVVKLQPDGTPDPGFGTGGKATVAFDLGDGNDDIAYGAALQPDGKFVFVGFTGSPTPDIALARLDVDGELDPSFGFAGKQLLKLDVGGNLFDAGVRGRIQDGYLVIGGVAATASADSNFMAARIIIDTLFDDGFD
jgi:uncharacterized delta-60 repeat protein